MKFFVFLLLFFVAASVFLYFYQRHMIYFPSKMVIEPEHYAASDMRSVVLNTEDGLKLTAWYKEAKAGLPTLVYFHGNAGHIGYRMPLVRMFLNQGIGVLLVEYRGYADNPGSPSETGLYKDGRAAIEFLKNQGVDSKQLVLFGESLGTGIATQMAVEYPVSCLVLQSPFTSFVALARYHYPWILIKPWDKFASIDRIANISAPIMILHGKQDWIVPYVQAEELAQKAQKATLQAYPDKGHNDLWHQHYVDTIINYIDQKCTLTN